MSASRPSRRRTSSSSGARSRAASRAHLRGAGPERRARLAQGRARRRAGGARRAAEVGGGDRLQPRPGALPHRRDDGGARPGVRRALLAARTRCTARSTAGSGTPASPTSSRRCSARRTPSPGRTSTSRSPSRPASSRSIAPDELPLLGLVSRIAPALTGGNAVVALASETQPLAAVELAEAIATSDVPGGVVNLLTGQRAELAPWLASHMDVNAIDVTGADGLRADARDGGRRERQARRLGEPDGQSLYEISAFLELKTVWHPIGV